MTTTGEKDVPRKEACRYAWELHIGKKGSD